MVEDKEKLNRFIAKLRLTNWLSKNFAFSGDIQLHYKDIEPKIIAEKYIKSTNQYLVDYRFICFDGVVHYCWVNFYTDNNEHFSNIYDMNWDIQPWKFDINNTPYTLEKPDRFDEMVSIATILAQDFSHVRVDLYNVDGKIYFGEMTFTSTGGFRLITPKEYNYRLGELWDITGEN